MIKVKEIESWSLFEEEMRHLLSRRREPITPQMVFRGQSNASWRLETTLDRVIGSNIKISAYYSMVERVEAEIETFTNKEWNLPRLQGLDELLFGEDSVKDYMGYLRHHGFPSPLLDWTLSPYVAAFFAFRDLSSKAESVAIYEYWQGFELGGRPPIGVPTISFLGGNPRSNKRHYLQQSVYTICTKENDDGVYFIAHEDAYLQAEGNNGYLTKYILPASERTNALLSLESYNINAYSLIGSEESLLETVFFRYYGLRKKWKDEYPNWDGNDW